MKLTENMDGLVLASIAVVMLSNFLQQLLG